MQEAKNLKLLGCQKVDFEISVWGLFLLVALRRGSNGTILIVALEIEGDLRSGEQNESVQNSIFSENR